MNRLHLGCGSVYLPGYINLEYAKKFMGNSFKVDAIGSGMILPFKDSSLDEIISFHVIEHLPRPTSKYTTEKWRPNVDDFLKECFRTLKIGGKLIIECPDIKGVFQQIVNSNNWSMIDHVYGLDRYEGDTHQWGYTRESIKELLKCSGFDSIKVSDGTDYHTLDEPSIHIEAMKINLKRINIEPTPACNLACKFCSRIDKIRPNKAMDMGLYRSILHQLFTLGLTGIELRLFLSGEPLIAGNNLISMLKHADNLGFKNSLIHTNGTLLDKYGDDILEAGLGKISISVDGIDKETYENVRVNGSFYKVVNNARDFIRKSKSYRTKTVIQTIIPHGQDKNFNEQQIKILIPDADEYYVRYPHNWDTADSFTGFSTYDRKTRSCFPSEMLSIYADGRVPICCADLNGSHILADASKEPLLDIWINKLGSIRERMKKLEPIPELCDGCERYGKAAVNKALGESPAAMELRRDLPAEKKSKNKIDKVMQTNILEKIHESEELIRQKKLNEAKEVLIDILQNYDDESVDAANNLAAVDILLGEYGEAADILKQVIEKDPANETALNNIGLLKEQLNLSLKENGSESDKGLSIIIPIYNKKELTINCLKSLHIIKSEINFEVIVVDNGSDDGSAEEIYKLKPLLSFDLSYLRNDMNLGFAKANNIGAQTAKYNNLLFLNNDTIAVNDFLKKPVEWLSRPNVGIVGIKLLYPDNLIQHAGLTFTRKKLAAHLFKFYPSEFPPANISKEMQAVTGAALFIKKDLYINSGGFDEIYINGQEDVDLCMRVRDKGLKIWYCADSFIYHLESQSANRMDKAIQNRTVFLQKWTDKIICDEDDCYNQIDNLTSIKSFKNKFQIPYKINFAVKIGVPDRTHKNWGDIFYAESLAASLRKSGHNCVLHYLNEWDQTDKNIDVVIHLKGLSSYTLKKHNINVLWIINHPELHTAEEINSYDLVFTASKIHLEKIKEKILVPFYYLPQAADINIFHPGERVEKDIDILFIGNNYEFKNNRCRKIIEDIKSIKKDYNLKVYGEKWEGYLDEKYIAGKFIEWKKLPVYYRRAKIVLNDHQKTMRLEGFINNRTYDIAAAEGFQISDHVAGLSDLSIVTYKDVDDLEAKLDYFLVNDNERDKIAKENFLKIQEYNFDKRASEIIYRLKDIQNRFPLYTSCGICGYNGNDFLDMSSRKKVRCPKCHSLERQRALWFLLNRENLIQPAIKVLEIAPLNNTIFRKKFEENGCSYVCIDKWKTGNPLDKRDTSWIDYEMDICSLKFENESFDLIIMQHVIEEVPDDKLAFTEISRVLKKTGKAVLEIPHNINLRKTIEYNEPGKFGNVREYGVDFYQRLNQPFPYKEEIKIDNVVFSVLSKINKEPSLNFPVLLDHSLFNADNFTERFSSAVQFFNNYGYASLTVPQVENLLYQRVNYKRPVWLTLDDGCINDIEKALPILSATHNFSSAFLIPNRLSVNELLKWKEVSGNKFLNIQSHSLNHKQVFVSSKLVGVFKGETKYSDNLLTDTLIGYPIFEYGSAVASKKFIPYAGVIDYCLRFWEINKKLDEKVYISKLIGELNNEFKQLGEYENESEYQERIENEIEESRRVLQIEFNSEIYAFSFPWGLYSKEALELTKRNHTLALRVLPGKVNNDFNPYGINRIEIQSSGYLALVDSMRRSRNWEYLKLKENPLVTVLMTTYNRVESVADAIQSVIDQTFKDWNLYLINDGGEDISEIVRTFNDSRIKYFNIEHKGKAHALNFGIRESKSKYIAYLDDDDKYHPNHLDVLISYLEKHPERKFVYSVSEEVYLIEQNGQWIEKDRAVRYSGQVLPFQFRLMNHIPNLCALHSRHLFDQAGLYDEELKVLIDWDMYRRLALASPPAFINEVTSEYRRKVTAETYAFKQITGMHATDPIEYYKNRLKILGKPFQIPNFPGEYAAIVYLKNQSTRNILTAAAKLVKIRNSFQFQIIFIIDSKLDEELVNTIRYLEKFAVLFHWNNAGISQEIFLKSILEKSCWTKNIIYDDAAEINSEAVETGFNRNYKIINYARSFARLLGQPLKIQKNSSPFISIIMPLFNRWDFTMKCLDNIYKQSPDISKFEIIVIDNGSTDETSKSLTAYTERFNNIKVINNNVNLGFAKANNIAARQAKGKYIVFLNNDTQVQPKWLERLSSVLDNDDAVGAAGSKLLFPDNTIQHAGVILIDDRKSGDPLLAKHIYYKEAADLNDADVKRTYQALTAACIMIRKKAFDEVNGFDETFWNGYEDVDLCLKLNKTGYKLVYQPESVVIHYESQSGPERFSKVKQNIELLHNKWIGKILPDFILKEDGIMHKTNAGVIKNYYQPVNVKKKVSIIALTYNQLEYTKKFIDSVIKYSGNDYELILIDNASADGTPEFLKTLMNDLVNVKIILNKVNLGFPAAVNQGILNSSSDFILIANNDILVTDGWLQRMIEVAETDPKIGLVGPISNDVSGLQLDKNANYSSINEMYKYAKKIRAENFGKNFSFPRVAFLCTLIKRDVIEEIGGLDERFSPGNFEDDDFCLRAQLAGYKTIIAEDVFIHHFGSKSFKAEGGGKYSEQLQINKEKFTAKWGADPEEIWIKGKDFRKREVRYPVCKDLFKESFERVQIHVRENEYEPAANEILRAVENYPENNEIKFADLLNLGGNIFMMIHDYERAQKFFEEALKSDPASSHACTGLGEIFFISGMYNESKTMFEWGVKNNPANKAAHEGLVKVNQFLGLEAADLSAEAFKGQQ